MKRLRIVHQSDETSYELEVDVPKDPVYAIDAADVVHLWWPNGKDGFSSCGLARDDVITFQVENLATCMTCLAQKEEETAVQATMTQLERDLRKSLKTTLGHVPDKSAALQNVMNAFGRYQTMGVFNPFKIEDDVK